MGSRIGLSPGPKLVLVQGDKLGLLGTPLHEDEGGSEWVHRTVWFAVGSGRRIGLSLGPKVVLVQGDKLGLTAGYPRG